MSLSYCVVLDCSILLEETENDDGGMVVEMSHFPREYRRNLQLGKWLSLLVAFRLRTSNDQIAERR